MAALEFAKLHAHVAKSAPKKADERTSRATERALGERWGFRRGQAVINAPSNDDAERDRDDRQGDLKGLYFGTQLIIWEEPVT
jgi:hypothetical protein